MVMRSRKRLQVRDYLNRGAIDRVRVSTGQGSEDHGHGVYSEGAMLLFALPLDGWYSVPRARWWAWITTRVSIGADAVTKGVVEFEEVLGMQRGQTRYKNCKKGDLSTLSVPAVLVPTPCFLWGD